MKKGNMMFGIGLAAMISIGLTAVVVSAEKSGGLVVPDKVITIDGKKPAKFDHAVHVSQSMACGQCHHNKEHQPLTADDIAVIPDAKALKCVSCHNGSFANTELQKPKVIFHARCRDCHKAGYNDKKGPSSCKACHVKTKKRAIEGC